MEMFDPDKYTCWLTGNKDDISKIKKSPCPKQKSGKKSPCPKQKSGKKSPKTSKYIGVSVYTYLRGNKRIGPYITARAKIKGKLIHIGYFNSEEDAAVAYDKYVKEFGTDRMSLNFP